MGLCFQAAEHLLTVAITDKDNNIQFQALCNYKAHPYGGDVETVVQLENKGYYLCFAVVLIIYIYIYVVTRIIIIFRLHLKYTNVWMISHISP